MPPAWLGLRAREPTLSPVKSAGVWTSTNPGPALLYGFGGIGSSTGLAVTPLTAIQVSTVYGCVKARSEDLAKVPLQLRRRLRGGGTVVERDHPVARLLAKPNDYMGPFVFKRFLEASVCFRGNAYVAIGRDDEGTPRALIPVSPDSVLVEMTNQGRLLYRVTHPLIGTGKVISADDVLHIKNFGLDHGYVGISPIAAASEAIGLALAAQQHGAALFRQGAQKNLYIKHPASLSPAAKQNLSSAFEEQQAGIGNAFKTPVMDEGMELIPIGMSSEDAQLLGMRQFQRIEICGAYRCPPHKVMDLEHAHFANVELQNLDYIGDALMPDAQQVVEEFGAKLLFSDEQDQYELAWDWEELLKADRKTRLDGSAIGVNSGILTVNEGRAVEGLAPVEGGDVLRVPLNTARIDGGGTAGTTPTGAPGNTAPNPMPALPAPRE